MTRYYIETQHRPEDCLNGLDDVLAQGEQALSRYDFGCAVGDHTNHVCYTNIEAASEAAARASLPRSIADKAKVTEVGKFTAAQIRSFHSS